jgi:hypothetical protein
MVGMVVVLNLRRVYVIPRTWGAAHLRQIEIVRRIQKSVGLILQASDLLM